MELTVQKFGGSSVANTERLYNVCNHIIKEYNKGNNVVVIVSAQGKTTDKLIGEEQEITSTPNKREHDVLVSVGEQITIAKLVMCLEKLNYKAISYLGHQLPILTDSNFGDANILEINIEKIKNSMQEHKIVVVAGFQGMDANGDITTLGRGGSDTTAVALAHYLNADNLYIYTDVDGVYSDDPNVNKDAKKIDELDYNTMIQMSKSGAKVLHYKCVEFARKYNVPIIVKSTFEEEGRGTLIH